MLSRRLFCFLLSTLKKDYGINNHINEIYLPIVITILYNDICYWGLEQMHVVRNLDLLSRFFYFLPDLFVR